MAYTDINGEDRLVQQTFAAHLEKVLGWESGYAYNTETLGPQGTLGRASEREVVLVRDLRTGIAKLNPHLPESVREQAIEKLTHIDFARSLIQHNCEYYNFIRGGVPVEWRDASGERQHTRVHVIDFRNVVNYRFLAVRELRVQGVRVPHYNRRADLVCFVNGLPLVFIELKAVYRNIRAGFDDNLTITCPNTASPMSSTTTPFWSSATAIRPAMAQSQASRNILLSGSVIARPTKRGWMPRRYLTECLGRSVCST